MRRRCRALPAVSTSASPSRPAISRAAACFFLILCARRGIPLSHRAPSLLPPHHPPCNTPSEPEPLIQQPHHIKEPFAAVDSPPCAVGSSNCNEENVDPALFFPFAPLVCPPLLVSFSSSPRTHSPEKLRGPRPPMRTTEGGVDSLLTGGSRTEDSSPDDDLHGLFPEDEDLDKHAVRSFM